MNCNDCCYNLPKDGYSYCTYEDGECVKISVLEKENAELKEELKCAEHNCKVKQEFNDNQFNAIMKLKDEFTKSLAYAKSIIKDLLDNSDEYTKQRAREFLKENKKAKTILH